MAERKTREQTAQARRQLLVEVAAECFAEKGFHQTSMRDLAERAGVSLGNVYNHFDSKTDLIREIAKLEADGLQAIQVELDRISAPADALNHFVQLYANSCADKVHALLTAEIISEGLRHPEVCDDFLRNRHVLLASVADTIREVQRTAPIAATIEPTDCAEFVLDLVEGFAMRFAFEGKKPTLDSLTVLQSGVHRLVGSSP